MRQSRRLSLAAMTLLGLTGTLAASASAELPNVLPEAVTTATTECLGFFKFGNGLLHLLTAETKGCVGTQETAANGMTGTFATTLLGVKDTTGRKCNTAGDPAGTLKIKGTFDTQFYLDSKKVLQVALAIKPATTTFKCGTLEITVLGCTAGKLSKTDELVKLLLLSFTLNGSDNEPVKLVKLGAKATTELENCEDLSKTDAETTYSLANQEGTIDITKFTSGGKEATVLLMSK